MKPRGLRVSKNTIEGHQDCEICHGWQEKAKHLSYRAKQEDEELIEEGFDEDATDRAERLEDAYAEFWEEC